MSNPNLFLPPEWAPQSAVWVGWPHLRGEWGTAFDAARGEIAAFVRALSKVTPVRIACGSREAFGSAWFALESQIKTKRVSLHTLPAGDIWLRDTGPIIALQGERTVALGFGFNGWGGKYLMPGDTMTAGGIASVESLMRQSHDFILEGGAIDVDGAGRLLTTKQCLLNPNRNPGWTQTVAERELKQAFAIEQVIWLGDGLHNDHTDGHIDNIARFIGPGRVLCQSSSGHDDPNAETYAAIQSDLRAAGLETITIPSPGRIEDTDGASVPASHLNFLISNGHIYMPVYEDIYSHRALAAIKAAMPDYEVIGLAARNILAGGGAFHCMTQQVPTQMEESV
ncbi:MAG: agmatine deiminase family protein [Pseudomonadota bacterium]